MEVEGIAIDSPKYEAMAHWLEVPARVVVQLRDGSKDIAAAGGKGRLLSLEKYQTQCASTEPIPLQTGRWARSDICRRMLVPGTAVARRPPPEPPPLPAAAIRQRSRSGSSREERGVRQHVVKLLSDTVCGLAVSSHLRDRSPPHGQPPLPNSPSARVDDLVELHGGPVRALYVTQPEACSSRTANKLLDSYPDESVDRSDIGSAAQLADTCRQWKSLPIGKDKI
jgi:hypothetical protein